MSVMIDHISFGVRDIEAAKQFYDAVLKPLGIVRLYGGADFAAYGRSDKKDDLSIHQAGEGWVPDPKVHIAFCAPSRAAVEAFHRQGLQAGGLDDGGPAIRDEYAEDYFAAFLKDPDGQRIEAVCRLKQVEDSGQTSR
jgi:catechol 2,3-dioxygenase-like lactoylglutathione lyase family enzyme